MTLENAWSNVSGTKQWVARLHTSQWTTRSIASYLLVVQHSWSEKNHNAWLALCCSVMRNNKGAEIISLQKLLVWLGKHRKKRQVVKKKDDKNSCEKYKDGIQKCVPSAPLNSRPGILKLLSSSDLNWSWTFFESKLYFLPSSVLWAKIGILYTGNPNTDFIWGTAINTLTSKCYDYTSISYSINLGTNLKQQGFFLHFFCLFFSVKQVITTHAIKNT